VSYDQQPDGEQGKLIYAIRCVWVVGENTNNGELSGVQ
jgi:hypothetical protein